MKTLLLMPLLAFMGISSLFGQLNTLHNRPRPGDILVKQQVEFKRSGQAGKDRRWDFGKLKTINSEYTLIYSLPPLEGDSVYILGNTRYRKDEVSEDELIVGTEHNTMYYYRLSGDTLYQMGHENPAVVLSYTRPPVLMAYPLNYGQSVVSDYSSEGLYSGTVEISTRGRMITSADAYGKLILPSGDSISPALRVKTTQTIIDNNNGAGIANDNEDKLLETCRWYTKGYRYPVFETVRSINLKDSSEVFSTAFFYPPQDHLYLDTDPDNLALLEEMWNMEQKDDALEQQARTVTLADILTCRIYPNPVVSIMNLEYELKEDADVSFDLYSIEGLPARRIKAKKRKAGTYYETIDCSTLRPKNYVLRITANGVFVNEVIIKK